MLGPSVTNAGAIQSDWPQEVAIGRLPRWQCHAPGIGRLQSPGRFGQFEVSESLPLFQPLFHFSAIRKP